MALTLLLLPAPALAGEGWWGALDEGEAVSLADVMRGPRDYRDRIITFFCVFYTADGEFKYYPPNTAFSEQRHLNFSVWPDGAPVWEERTYKTGQMPFMYLRRTNAQRGELVRLPAFTRLEVTGRIRDIVRGTPAIEVFSFRATGHRLGEAVVKHVIRGNGYARAGTTQGYQLAARSFKDALQPDLPPVYDMIVRKLLADTLRKLGFPEEARAYENGESVGMPELPTPDADQGTPAPSTMPDDLPQPFGAQDSGTPRPAAPTPYGSPDGSPDGAPPTGALPPVPLGPDEAAPPAGSTLPPAAPSYTDEPGAAPPPPRSGIPPKRRVRLSGVR
jgi:hypothetical protein